jgi:hypothetical protein
MTAPKGTALAPQRATIAPNRAAAARKRAAVAPDHGEPALERRLQQRLGPADAAHGIRVGF